MKRAALFFCLATAVFGQSTPDNVAAEALKRRLQGSDLLRTPNRPTLTVIRPGASTAGPRPGVCAIPLRNAVPSARLDPKIAVVPRAQPTPGDELVRVPAPACESK
jgi:hypothetical protein